MATKTHAEYNRLRPLWIKVADCLKGQEHIHSRRECYLPMTAGMKKNKATGMNQYNAYLCRARFPEVTQQALAGITGLAFQKAPKGDIDERVTSDGRKLLALARECFRAVTAFGRDLLLVDAPFDGGMPYISRYPATSLINWQTDDMGLLSSLVLSESKMMGGKAMQVFRRYERADRSVQVLISNDQNEILESYDLAFPEIPAVIVGSIDNTPDIDPIPLLPIANAALAAYKLSADHRHALHLAAQPTPWVNGIQQEQYDSIVAQGIGSSSLWYLGEEGQAGFLETNSLGIAQLKEEIADEMKQAESYGVRLTQNGSGVEAAESVRLRAASQHASIYSIVDSVAEAINQVMRWRAQWAGLPEPEPFEMFADFTRSEANYQILNAMNAAVNAGNIPVSVLHEYLRKTDATEKSQEELEDELLQVSLANS